MPKMGGKIWFTAIAGLILGFVFFGMLQRGCDAQGEAPIATADQFEPQARDFNASSRNNTRSIDLSARSNSNSNNAKGRRSRARENAKNRRASRSASRPSTTRSPRSALERNTRTRNRADAARKAELARLTRERTARYRERSRAARADDPNTIDPALRTRTTGGSTEDIVAQTAAEVSDDLRSRRGEGGAGSGSGSGSGEDVGGAGQRSEDGSGDGDSGDSGSEALDEFAEIEALLEGLGLDESFVELIRDVVTNGAPPTNPFANNDDDDDDDDDVSQPIDDQDPIDAIDLTTPVLARWLPVEQSGCNSLGNQGLETRDLYLAFLVQPIAPPVVSSTEENSIVILDGSFHQDAAGSNGPPVGAGSDCAAYDSYLTIGKAAPTFLSAPNVSDWGDRLLAEWFAIFGAEIDQSVSKFGNQRFHIHVGRFTAEEEAKIFGKLRVDYAGQLAIVDVPDWQGASTDGLDDEIPAVLPKVDSVQFDSSGVLGGSTLMGLVTIDRPAPEGGLEIQLTTDSPRRVSVPSSVHIVAGATDAMFEIRTSATGVIEDVLITAIGPDSSSSGTLRLEAPALSSFTVLKSRLLEGETTSAVLVLTNPAVPGGTTITLDVDNTDAVTLPSTIRIPVGHQRTVLRITGNKVDSSQNVSIRAGAGGVNRTISMQVASTIMTVDGNNDGVVDTADLGMLIAEFGSDNPLFDFNSDGVVDTADLGLLNALFGESYEIVDGGDGPGDNPGGGSDDAVIAKWIDVPYVDCDQFPGSRTAELYLGFLNGPALPVISSLPEDGITVSNGEFLHHLFGTNNPPSESVLAAQPCRRYDSFLSVGDAAPVILGILDRFDWGSTLDAAWFSIDGTSEQNPGKFGDDRHYVRIGNFTSQATATIAGRVRVDYAGELAIVEVPDWTIASALALDLNFDGQIDAGDVSLVTRAYGKANPAYDFDGDGVVDGDDLRPLLNAIQLQGAD